MRSRGIWHPFIYAFVAVLSLFANNTNELSLQDDGAFGRVIFPCLVTFILALALYLFACAIFSDPHKRGIAALFGLLAFCSYGHFLDFYYRMIVGVLGVDLRFDLWAWGDFSSARSSCMPSWLLEFPCSAPGHYGAVTWIFRP